MARTVWLNSRRFPRHRWWSNFSIASGRIAVMLLPSFNPAAFNDRCRQFLQPLTQRRNEQGEAVQTLIKVFPEFSLPHSFPQRAVWCADDPRVGCEHSLSAASCKQRAMASSLVVRSSILSLKRGFCIAARGFIALCFHAAVEWVRTRIQSACVHRRWCALVLSSQLAEVKLVLRGGISHSGRVSPARRSESHQW